MLFLGGDASFRYASLRRAMHSAFTDHVSPYFCAKKRGFDLAVLSCFTSCRAKQLALKGQHMRPESFEGFVAIEMAKPRKIGRFHPISPKIRGV
jgi:hypothetical protein